MGARWPLKCGVLERNHPTLYMLGVRNRSPHVLHWILNNLYGLLWGQFFGKGRLIYFELFKGYNFMVKNNVDFRVFFPIYFLYIHFSGSFRIYAMSPNWGDLAFQTFRWRGAKVFWKVSLSVIFCNLLDISTSVEWWGLTQVRLEKIGNILRLIFYQVFKSL